MKKVFLVAALLALPAAAFAQTAPNPATQQFVQKAAVSDMFEIQSSQLALEKSSNDQIKQFARTMVDDHTRTSNEMKSIVQNMQGMQIPAGLDQEHQSKLEQLRAASGSQFDQRYRTEQINGHQAAVALFDNYSNSGDNAQLKGFAQTTLPKLREHLQQAQALPQAGQAPAVAMAPGGQGQQAQASGQGGAGTVLATPQPGQMLGSDLRGTEVRSATNENIGEIDDVLLDPQGRIVAVIVGVGGFLGIGEKNVAIPFQALEMTGTNRAGESTGSATGQQAQRTATPGGVVLRGMTKADLENAPAFRNEATTGQGGGAGGQQR